MKKILLFLLFVSSFATAQIRVGTATGTNDYIVTFNPPITAFNTYAVYSITFANGNTLGAVTLDPDGAVAATSIKDNAGSTLVAGAIRTNATYNLRFDGTNLRMIEWVNPPTKNITWITKGSSYIPVPADTLLAEVGFIMSSTNALSFTIPNSAAVNFNLGTKFKIRNGNTGVVSILEGAGVTFESTPAGPWTLDENEYAVISKLDTLNTWELTLFKRQNISTETIVPVFTEYSTVGNVTTGEDVLFSDTLAAGTMSTDGNLISGRFSGIIALNGNDKTVRLKFGATTIATRLAFDSPTVGQGWTLDYQVIRTSATTQKTNATFSFDGISSAYYAAASEDMATDIVIQLTGESTATNDIVKHTASGNFNPGAGSGSEPPPIEPPVIPFVIVDNAVRGAQGYQWDYVSTWATPGTGITGWYNLTLDYTGTTNAYAEITFNGTRIQLYTEKLNTHGIFEVSLDGVVVDTVDLYSATQQLQALVFDTGDADDPDNEEGPLTQAVHTLKLRCTGTKNASSSAYYLLIDYVKIENPETVPDEEIPVPPATANNFVTLGGSDGGANNCNTAGTPCRTITYALTQMTSGDVLSVGAGTFVETAYLAPTTGESIIGAGVDVTIIKVVSGLDWSVDCSGANQTKAIFQYTAAGSTAQVLSDLTIEGNITAGDKKTHGGLTIGSTRNNVTVEDVKITSFDYFGAYVTGNDHTFHNVQIINSAEAAACFSTGNLMIGGTEDFMCDNVDISDNSGGYGVKSWGGNVIIESHTFKNSEIRILANSPYGGGGIPNIAYEFAECRPRNCVFQNNYTDNCVSLVRVNGATNDGIPSVHITNNTFDIITKGGGNSINTPIELSYHNVEIDNNHFVGGRYAYIVSWNVNETAPAINWDIHHNTFYCVGHVNSPTGILRSSYAGFQDVDFYNNTIHIPPSNNFYTTLFYTGCCGVARSSTDIQCKNNVIYDQSTSDGGVGGASQLTRLEGSGGGWSSSNFEYNTVVGMSTTLPGGWTVSNTLTNGPSFQGGGGVNPSPFVYDPFYRPAAGSPLLNSGTNVGFGATPDRGRIQD